MVIGKPGRAWLAAAALMCGVPLGATAQSGSPAERVLAAVDVEITQRVSDANGAAEWPSQPPTAFTVQKLRTPDGATKIVLAYRATGISGRTLVSSHPLDGARVEYEASTGGLTVFDQGGTRRNPRLSLDGPSGASIGSPGEWLDGLVLAAATAPARRLELERIYGRAVGSAGRLTRYLQIRDGVSEQVLVDPLWDVPMEITVSRQGAREARVTFDYGPTPSGNLFRRAIRSERLIDPVAGRWSVLAMQFSNVRAEGW